MRQQEIKSKSLNFAEEINRQLDETFGLEISEIEELSHLISNTYYQKKKINTFLFKSNETHMEITESNATLILNINFKNVPIKDEVNVVKEEIESMKADIIQCLQNHETKTGERYFFYFVNCHFGNGKLIENFKSKKSTISMNGELSWIKDLSQLLNEKVNTLKTNIPQNKVKIGFTHTDYMKKGEDFEIDISSRIKSAHATSLNKFDVSGRVFTASLYSISKLYSHIGDDLYKHNLRKRLSGRINGVDESIEKTLKENPERFWYFNNGITVLVDSKHVNYDDPEIIRINNIGSDYSDDFLYPVSIINGAQTVSVANEYFSKINLSKDEHQQLKNSRDYAEVILRVVSFDSSVSDKESVSEWVDEISVSLNRQKPIKSEDMVYNHRLINAVNKVKDEKFDFEILRRGYDVSVSSRKYNLISVMKLFRSYLDSQPGAAKTGSGSLINIDDTRVEVEIEVDKNTYTHGNELLEENDKITVNILFADNFSLEKRQQLFKHEVFDKNYKPVNYLMKLYSKLKKLKRDSNWNLNEYVQSTSLATDEKSKFDSKSVEAIRKYGEYHLIDAITQYELKNNNIDLAGWTKGSKDADRDFSDDSIKKMVLAYSYAWKDYLDEKIKKDKIKNNKKREAEIDYSINLFKQNLESKDHKKIIDIFTNYMNKI